VLNCLSRKTYTIVMVNHDRLPCEWCGSGKALRPIKPDRWNMSAEARAEVAVAQMTR
jgi:hypothetical protein